MFVIVRISWCISPRRPDTSHSSSIICVGHFLIYSILIFAVLLLSVKCNSAGWDAENTQINRTATTSSTFTSVCYKFGFFGFSFRSHVVRTPSSPSVFASAKKPLVTVGQVSCFDPQSTVSAARNGENRPDVSWKQ